MNKEAKARQLLVGKVVSNKMERTVVVEIERLVAHPLYGKYIRRSTKVQAHDGKQECREGDVVQLVSARPISKRKSWVVDCVLAKAS